MFLPPKFYLREVESRWLNRKSADLDVQCFQETEKFWFSRTRVKVEDNLSLAWFYHTSAPAKLKKDKTTTTINGKRNTKKLL